MFAKHITVYFIFTSYFSFTANIKTHSRIAKFLLSSLIIIGLIGVLFAITAAYGKLLWFNDLASQSEAAKHIALYNLMTICLLPAVTETKVTLPSGEPVKIGEWFYQTSRWIIKPVRIEGLLYLFFIFFFTLLPTVSGIWNFVVGEFALFDVLAVPLFALGVMMYFHALRQSKEDDTFNKPEL